MQTSLDPLYLMKVETAQFNLYEQEVLWPITKDEKRLHNKFVYQWYSLCMHEREQRYDRYDMFKIFNVFSFRGPTNPSFTNEAAAQENSWW